MRYRAILFDMDGTLIDSERLMTKVGIMALHDFGVEAKPEDFEEFVGRGEDLYIGGVARKHGVQYDPAMKKCAYDYYGQLVGTEAAVPPEALDVLNELKRRGLKMAVCSSADREKVVYNVRAIGVSEDFFGAFVTGSEIEHLKPAPDIYLKGAELLGAAPEECLVVEDAPSGILAAHAAGMRAVGITASFPEQTLAAQAKPEYIIHNLNQLLELV